MPLGFTLDFFGISRSSVFVNNNGNVTFDSALGTYTPFDLTSTGQEIIAPFFADVDTGSAGDPVTYGGGTFEGRPAFGVNWINVDYYDSDISHTNRNSFQLILVDRSDIASGDFDIVFNYDQIQWEAGEASDGDENGLGGDSARVGYSNGTGDPGTFFELPGSAINGAFLDGGPSALVSNRLNSTINGRYIFRSRTGGIDPGTPPSAPAIAVPTGHFSGWLLLALFLLSGGLLAVRRF
ncbi:MAG: nidogen-like domain-containing protein [Wenzhouxiangellaceae bacterium]